jgi:putative tricarboxylic transport membrane protein
MKINKWATALMTGFLALSLSACSSSPNFGGGSNYPSKPITIVAPSGAGGGWDQTARSISKVLNETKLVDKTITVENRPGGGGAVFMAEYATQEKKNSYKLFVNSPPILINNLKKEGNSPYGYQDTTPLAQLTKDYGIYAVKTDSPIKDMPALINKLKQNPSSIAFAGGSAPGSMDHLISVLPAYKSGIDIKKLKYISYDGGGEAIAALLGGNADVVSTDASSVLEYVKSGKVRVLAVAAPEKLTGELKDVPTLKELGIDAEFTIWRGIFGPKEMDATAKTYWDEKLKALSENETWKKEIETRGWIGEYKGSADFTKFLQEQNKQVKELLTSLGMNK